MFSNKGEFFFRRFFCKSDILTFDLRTFDRFHAHTRKSCSSNDPDTLGTLSRKKVKNTILDDVCNKPRLGLYKYLLSKTV